MLSTFITLDLKKLLDYKLDFISDLEINQSKEILVALEMYYQTEESYNLIKDEFKALVDEYNLQDHYSELLYLMIKGNETIREKCVVYWQNYNDAITSKELACFLLSYVDLKPNDKVQITVKPSLAPTAHVKQNEIARWMCGIIYEQIEQRNFPLGLFGTKILNDLFGNENLWDGPLAVDRLRNTAEQRIKKPTSKINSLYVELCKFMQVYLNGQTHLSIPEGLFLTDDQANFFFKVLRCLGYLDELSFGSEPKDYIHVMFRNAKLSGI